MNPQMALFHERKNMLTTGFLGSLFSDKPAETKCGMPKKNHLQKWEFTSNINRPELKTHEQHMGVQ
jgi:hypothetical protein